MLPVAGSLASSSLSYDTNGICSKLKPNLLSDYLSSEPTELEQLRKKECVVKGGGSRSFSPLDTPSHVLNADKTVHKKIQSAVPLVGMENDDESFYKKGTLSKLTHMRLLCDTRSVTNMFIQSLTSNHKNLVHIDLAGGSMIDDEGVSILMEVCPEIKVCYYRF
jgi:hypothetical protein